MSEARIVDLATHPRRYVSCRVAAAYLEVDPKTLAKYFETGLIVPTWFGRRRKVSVAALVAFEQRQQGGRRA